MAAQESPPIPLPTTMTSYSSAGTDDLRCEVVELELVELVVVGPDEGVVDVYSRDGDVADVDSSCCCRRCCPYILLLQIAAGAKQETELICNQNKVNENKAQGPTLMMFFV
jgi:hypothetical protein